LDRLPARALPAGRARGGRCWCPLGAADIIVDYYHANQVDLPAVAGELGATYAIAILYVPLLMIAHGVAFYRLVRPLIGKQWGWADV
jgi:hypothetical protein